MTLPVRPPTLYCPQAQSDLFDDRSRKKMPLHRLAVKYKTSLAAVNEALAREAQRRQVSLPRRPAGRPRRFLEVPEDLGRRWARRKVTAVQVAKELGCAPSTVYSLLARLGYPRPARPGDTLGLGLGRVPLVLRLVAAGLTFADIARRLGIQEQTARYYFYRRPKARPRLAV